MTKILPLPVKKNKFGELVADISAEKYYRQIAEEVLEAYKASIIAEIKKHMYFEECADCIDSYVGEDNEAEELVDIITCCVTRLDTLNNDKNNFEEYISELLTLAEGNYTKPKDFYVDLVTTVMPGYFAGVQGTLNFYFTDKKILAEIIFMCLKHLELLGYDEEKRQELYQAVNEKNRKRGYLEE